MVPADEALAELASDIMTFVQAECLGLLRRTRLFSDLEISVAEVRLATNRVVFTLAAPALAAPALRMSVSQLDGRLCCSLVDAGWMDRLSIPQRELLRYALTGLAALCGADETLDASEHGVPRPTEPIDWLSWQNTWEAHRRPHDQRTDRSAGPNAHTVGRP